MIKEKSEPQSSSSQLDPRAVLLMDPRADLLPQLLDFDEAQRQKVFDSKVFCCAICFVEKLGSNCLCFKECQHVYCKACMTEYFQIQIRDGNVQCLNCPEPKCTSLATPLQVRKLLSRCVCMYYIQQFPYPAVVMNHFPPFVFISQVKQLVDEELFARYDRLLLQSSLDLMADVVYCPRQSCGTAVMVEPDTTMGICSACQYAFCTLCKLGYHGLSGCKIPAGNVTEKKYNFVSKPTGDEQLSLTGLPNCFCFKGGKCTILNSVSSYLTVHPPVSVCCMSMCLFDTICWMNPHQQPSKCSTVTLITKVTFLR